MPQHRLFGGRQALREIQLAEGGWRRAGVLGSASRVSPANGGTVNTNVAGFVRPKSAVSENAGKKRAALDCCAEQAVIAMTFTPRGRFDMCLLRLR